MKKFDYFYTPYIPATESLQQQYLELLLGEPEVEKYLYITALSKILLSLNKEDQNSFVSQLALSELAANQWISTRPDIKELLQEHLERSILATHSQLL